MKDFGLFYIATLASGLGDTSRVKMKLSGQKADLKTILLAGCLDALNLLLWTKTKDAEHGRNRPKSMVSELMKEQESKQPEKSQGFSDPADMMKARRRILEKIKRGESK